MANRRKKLTTNTSTSKPKSASGSQPKWLHGSISSGIYDAVEKLVAERKLTRAAAFRQIARETGRLEGTVGVNYYYAAKRRGVKFPKRGMRRKAIAGPKLEGVGKRLAAPPGVPAAKRPKVDVAKLIERERNRWPW